MSSRFRTVFLVPLREEMKYIDKYLTEELKSPYSRLTNERYEPSHKVHVFERWNDDTRRMHDLTFIVLDDGDRQIMGNISTVAAAIISVQNYTPDVVILIGIAGSMYEKVRLGDVVFSTAAKMWSPDKLKKLDSKKEVFAPIPTLTAAAIAKIKKDKKILVDPRKTVSTGHFFRFRKDLVSCEIAQNRRDAFARRHRDNPMTLSPVDAAVLRGCDKDAIEALKNDRPAVHFGTLMGSEWVVDSAEFVTFAAERNLDNTYDYYSQKDALKAKPGEEGEGSKRNRRWDTTRMLAVDMESYGFFKAIETLNGFGSTVQAFSIRGISDLAAEKTDLDDLSEERVRRLCVHNATRVALDFVFAIEPR